MLINVCPSVFLLTDVTRSTDVLWCLPFRLHWFTLAQYSTLMVKLGKALHAVLIVHMVQTHYPVNFVSFLVVRSQNHIWQKKSYANVGINHRASQWGRIYRCTRYAFSVMLVSGSYTCHCSSAMVYLSIVCHKVHAQSTHLTVHRWLDCLSPLHVFLGNFSYMNFYHMTDQLEAARRCIFLVFFVLFALLWCSEFVKSS